MRKILLLFMSMIFLVTGCGNEKPSKIVNLNEFEESKAIIIGVDDEFPPICFHDENNNLVGFDIDLAKEAAKRMNVEIKFKSIDWNKKEEEITSGNIDMIWNGLDITEERKEYMIFTKSYMYDRQILMVKRGNNQGIYSESALEGKIVGIQAGSTTEDYFHQEVELKNSLKECKTYDKFNDLVEALKNGEIEMLICDEMIARYEMHKQPNQFELIDVRIGSIAEMAVGFRKDNTELRDKVQTVLEEMIKDGTAKKISIKWFNADLIK